MYYFERYFSAIFSIRGRILGGSGSKVWCGEGGGYKPTWNEVFLAILDKAIIEFSVALT